MAVSDLLGDAGVNIGGLPFFSTTIISNLAILIIAAIIVSIATYIWINARSYNKTIHIFEDLNGLPTPSGIDKAKEITLPFTSVRAILLKKHKFFLPRPSIQTGKSHYWYYIRPDGEWVNIGLENIDNKFKLLNIRYDHTDMRMANASLKKLVEKNYKKLNWLKEYAPYIGFAALILMLGIAGFLIIGEVQKVTDGLASAVNNMGEIAKSFENIALSQQNNVGSGVVEVVK